MTLVAYLRCQNGCVLLSDRKASTILGNHREVKKTFISDTKDFALCGAGSGFDTTCLFSILSQDNTVTSANIKNKIEQQVTEYLIRAGPYINHIFEVDALLVFRIDGDLQAYEAYIRGITVNINRIPTYFRCCGIGAATILANYLLKKIKLDELSWEQVAQYGMATMNEVAREVDGVGRIDEFGLDIIVLLENGEVLELENFRTESANLKLSLEALSKIENEFTKTHNSALGGN